MVVAAAGVGLGGRVNDAHAALAVFYDKSADARFFAELATLTY